MNNEIPDGFCKCGCGQRTLPATRTRRGIVKGQPSLFAKGHRTHAPIEQRFWSKVDKRGPDECWLWLAERNADGYGVFSLYGIKGFRNQRHPDKRTTAHRAGYILTFGPIDNDLVVCHKCDNPPCVNPAHLFIGTRSDNLEDMRQKGRQTDGTYTPRGEKHYLAKLSTAEVEEARRMYASGQWSYRGLARHWGMSYPGMKNIITGKSRKRG